MSSNSLEPGLDALHGTPGAAGLTLQEKEPGFLLQDGVRRAAGVACHILFCRENTGMSFDCTCSLVPKPYIEISE